MSKLRSALPSFCPLFDAVPDEFKRGNDYTRLLDHLFSGQPLPDGEIVFREGFDDTEAPALLNRVVMAHLRSFEPRACYELDSA